MKNINLVIVTLSLILFASCSDSDNELNTENSVKVNDIVSRQPGQIPGNIDFIGKINAANGDYISVIKDFKTKYGTTDFYNNLFEITGSYLFTSENFSQLDAAGYEFILDEMRMLESNISTIQYLPVLLNNAVEAKAITEEEYNEIAFELYTKNKKQLDNIKWQNAELRSEKISEMDKVSNELFYPRSRY